MPDHEISSARIGKWDKLDLVLPIGLTLFLVLLPFHLVIKKLIPDPLGTYWKEALLILLVLFWFLRSVLTHRPLLTKTRLDWAVLFYAGYLVLRFLLDRSGWVGGWGLYISIMYLPLFWLVPAALRDSPAWLERFLLLMVSVGMVAAAGGVIEFLLDRALWPSAETIQRQGFPDVFIYGTHLRRVYFVFDSPTTLANTLALLLPLAFALLLTTRRNWIRLVSGLAIALMTGCIVVTFSRGIWIASVLALVMMSLQSSFIQRNRRVLFAGLVGVVIILVVWGIYISTRSIVVENTTVVELWRTRIGRYRIR
jgi:hypothetical protein